MKVSKYIDVNANLQVLANIYVDPTILSRKEEFSFVHEDFPETIHKIVFGAMYDLYEMGATGFTPVVIEDYLKDKPSFYEEYKRHDMDKWFAELENSVQVSSFGYYYKRMKKMTLLRMYDLLTGMDLKWLYNPDEVLNLKKRQEQEQWLDNSSLEEIDNRINAKINSIRTKFVDNSNNSFSHAGDGIFELIERLQETPEIGYPLFGNYINTITKGARLKKFYLRSAATGVGKTRAMIADACSIACDEIFNVSRKDWVKNGTKESVLFITTEQEEDEVQTMMLAFLSAVDEEHIIDNKYEDGELERVLYAGKVIKDSKLQIKKMPDFSLTDIENSIKFSITEYNTSYVFLDYLHTSAKILNEITSKSGLKSLREDNILFMISIKLKDLCNQYDIFILTSTQLNADYVTAQIYDQNLLRGAKSIADKIDCGMIMLQVSEDDITALKPYLAMNNFPTPTVKISVYKNRRGRYKDILLWCEAERGICRINPMFVTNYRYEPVPIKDLHIEIKEEEGIF